MCSRRIDLRLVTYSQEKSAKGPLLACRIPGFTSITGSATKSRQAEHCLTPGTHFYRLQTGRFGLPKRLVPFVIRRPFSPGPGWPGFSGGASFPKLSKLLNQEDALSAPCLRGEFCSPQAAPSRGTGMLRTGVIRHFDVTLLFGTPSHHACRR
jgi:hypothetical protein